METDGNGEAESLVRRLGPRIGPSVVEDVPVGGDVGAFRATVSRGGRLWFARWAFSPPAIEGLRTELAVLAANPGIGPEVGAVDETDSDMVAIFEHLDPGSWATVETFDRVWEAVEAIGRGRAPAPMPRLEPGRDPWNGVEPERLGASADWVDRWKPSLAVAAGGVDLSGDDLVHGDLDLAHIWCGPERVVVVDWEFAAAGNPMLDRATVALDAVRLGADPATVDVGPGWPAYLAGVMAAAIQDGPPPTAREPILEVNRRIALLETALRWAAQLLGLPPPPEVPATG